MFNDENKLTAPKLNGNSPCWISESYDENLVRQNENHIYYRGLKTQMLDDFVAFHALMKNPVAHPCRGYQLTENDLVGMIYKNDALHGLKLYVETRPVALRVNRTNKKFIVYDSDINEFIANPEDSPFVKCYRNGYEQIYAVKGKHDQITKGVSQ